MHSIARERHSPAACLHLAISGAGSTVLGLDAIFELARITDAMIGF